MKLMGMSLVVVGFFKRERERASERGDQTERKTHKTHRSIQRVRKKPSDIHTYRERERDIILCEVRKME